MSTKIKLQELNVGSTFPATWEGTFTQKPTPQEEEAKKLMIQKLMNDEKKRQVRQRKASKGFELVFDWAKKREDPVTYALTVELAREEGFGKGKGQEVAPQPLKPPPPPK